MASGTGRQGTVPREERRSASTRQPAARHRPTSAPRTPAERSRRNARPRASTPPPSSARSALPPTARHPRPASSLPVCPLRRGRERRIAHVVQCCLRQGATTSAPPSSLHASFTATNFKPALLCENVKVLFCVLPSVVEHTFSGPSVRRPAFTDTIGYRVSSPGGGACSVRPRLVTARRHRPPPPTFTVSTPVAARPLVVRWAV